MRFHIRNQKQPGPELGEILVGLAQHTADVLRDFSGDAHEAIHSIRTEMKRARALLRIVEAKLPPKRCAKICETIRMLKNHYGPARDTAVRAELLRDLATPRELATGVGGEAGVPSSLPVPDAELIQQAEKLVGQLRNLPFREVTAAAMHKALAKTRRKCGRDRRKCLRSPTDAAFHRWRKSIKTFGYQATALRDPDARQAAKVSEDLGKANDLANLRQQLVSLHSTHWPKSLQARLERELAARRKRALDLGRSIH